MSGSTLFETGIALEALGFAWNGINPLYDVQIYAPASGATLHGGITLQGLPPLGAALTADTLIVPGTTNLTGPYEEDLLNVLRMAHDAGRRVVSICTGAFVLGAAGLLDNRSATTHWRHCDQFRRLFPRTVLHPDSLYVDDGVITGAGSTAGIDLCLYLIRHDHGAAMANDIARHLVVSAHRSGGQRQFSRAQPLTVEAGWLSQLQELVDADPLQDLSVDALCSLTGVSRRTLTRHFHDTLGTSPARWVTERRLHHACQLLERTTRPIDAVAAASGFSSSEAFRAMFRRTLGITPREYRAKFNSQN